MGGFVAVLGDEGKFTVLVFYLDLNANPVPKILVMKEMYPQAFDLPSISMQTPPSWVERFYRGIWRG